MRARSPARLVPQFSAFAAIGVANTLIDAAVFAGLVWATGWHVGLGALVASGAGFLAGSAHSYTWNSRFTFARIHRGDSAGSIARFAAVVLAGLAIASLVFGLVNAALPPGAESLALAKMAAIGAVTMWDFVLMRQWAFR